MNILITGITGRIGANLAKWLVERGHEVRGLVWAKDARVEKLKPLNVALVEGTLTSEEDVVEAVEGVTAIYHLGAAFQGGGPFSSQDYLEINVRGTFNILEAAARLPNLKGFFFASTDAIYDKYPLEGLKDPIREDTMPVVPSGWYALSKVLGEEMCRRYHRDLGLPVIILRFCYVVGAGEILTYRQLYLRHWIEGCHHALQAPQPSGRRARLETTLANLHAMWSGYEPLLRARDEQGRWFRKHLADVHDIVSGLVCGLDARPEAFGQAIQLAGPRPFTWEDGIPYLSKALGVHYVEGTVAGLPPINYEFDLTKARNLLGFQPQWDAFKMIDSAVAFREGRDETVLGT